MVGNLAVATFDLFLHLVNGKEAGVHQEVHRLEAKLMKIMNMVHFNDSGSDSAICSMSVI